MKSPLGGGVICTQNTVPFGHLLYESGLNEKTHTKCFTQRQAYSNTQMRPSIISPGVGPSTEEQWASVSYVSPSKGPSASSGCGSHPELRGFAGVAVHFKTSHPGTLQAA